MNFLLVFLLIIGSSFAHAHSEKNEQFIKDNRVVLVHDNITEKELNQFKKSFLKFPSDLNKELLDQGRVIHLIKGRGVTADPTWEGKNKTFDGRDWSGVPGAGGSTYWNRPTRIVVNRLHQGHGAIDLFLHEEAHTLDFTYGDSRISNNQAWTEVFAKTSVKKYLQKICRNYCKDKREAFAELFAHYYHSVQTRRQLELAAPEAATFFKRLRSIREASTR